MFFCHYCFNSWNPNHSALTTFLEIFTFLDLLLFFTEKILNFFTVFAHKAVDTSKIHPPGFAAPFLSRMNKFPDAEIHTVLLYLFFFFKPFGMAGKTAQEPHSFMMELEQNTDVLKCHSCEFHTCLIHGHLRE